MKRSEQLSNLYQSFCEAEGSQHIASEYAIEKINGLIEKFRVKGILEVGLGIGSLSGILLALNRNKTDLDYAGTEANVFCLNALKHNLKSEYLRLKIHKDLNALSQDQKYELIIIDGKDPDLNIIKELITINGIIAVEGDRIPQEEMLRKIFPKHQYVHSISLRKNKSYSPFPDDEWQGGLKIIFVNQTVKQYCWWLKEKIKTKMKYQYPGRYLGGEKDNRMKEG